MPGGPVQLWKAGPPDGPSCGKVEPVGPRNQRLIRSTKGGTPVRGSAEEIADALRAFGAAGFTNLELVVWPPTLAALDALAPVLELLDAD